MLALLWAAPVVAVTLLLVTGGVAGSADGLPDPGVAVRWGLPAVKAIRDLTAALTVGLLVSAAVLLPGVPGRAAATTPLQRQMLRLGGVAGTAWTVAGAVVLVFSYADLAGSPVLSAEVLFGVPLFGVEFPLGRALTFSVALTAVASLIAALVRGFSGAGVAAAAAVAALLPLAWTGHAAGTANHGTAVDAQAVHLVGVSVWVGGLAALAIIRPRSADLFPIIVRRYSTLAGWCFGMVAASGLIMATVRVSSWPALFHSTYGNLVMVKVAALTMLGAAGWWHRRALLPRMRDGQPGRVFARLAAGELAVMGAAIGVAVALSRTSPLRPTTEPDLTTAEYLLGYPMPPALTLVTIFTAWRLDPLWLGVALIGTIWYLRAVRRLCRRGDRWPWPRTLAFLAATATLTAALNGSPGVYGQVLFSMHMVQHMTIATAVPVFLVLSAPVTLALRTLPRRNDDSRGPREWLLVVIHSWPSRVVSHPLVAAPVFIGSLVVFYYSPAFELSLSTHLAHVLMIVHFLVSGFLFANVICGIDPGPTRPPYPFRLLLLILTFSFHAFFAVSLMAGTGVLAEDWYRQLPRSWGSTLSQDQSLGAALSWALGDYPVGILAIALVWSWVKSDSRDARRHDRQASRDGDAQLAAYNAYLAQLGQVPERPTQDTRDDWTHDQTGLATSPHRADASHPQYLGGAAEPEGRRGDDN